LTVTLKQEIEDEKYTLYDEEDENIELSSDNLNIWRFSVVYLFGQLNPNYPNFSQLVTRLMILWSSPIN
jgi:hypothetical protein